MDGDNFWRQLDHLAATCPVRVDRPRGSAHPRYPQSVYPLDYGYFQDTQSGDGAGINVWIGSLPDKRVTGVVCTVDGLKRDAEIKVLIGCTTDEARLILALHNEGDQGAVLLIRDIA